MLNVLSCPSPSNSCHNNDVLQDEASSEGIDLTSISMATGISLATDGIGAVGGYEASAEDVNIDEELFQQELNEVPVDEELFNDEIADMIIDDDDSGEDEDDDEQ